MEWFREKARSAREFLSYSARIQKRAAADSVRSLRRHFWSEVGIVAATALALAFTGPWVEWLSRVSAGLAGGLLTVLFLVALHYLFHLTVAPYRMFREIETELARFVPEVLERPLMGLFDFGDDVEKSRSANRLARCINRLSSSTDEMTAKLNAEMKKTKEGDPASKRRMAFRRIAKSIDHNARKLRRVHVDLAKSAADFDKTYRGYTGPMVAASTDEDTEMLKKSIQGSLASVRELKSSIYRARGATEEARRVQPWNIPVQSDYYISAGRLIESFSSIETTLGQLAESHEKVLREVKKGFNIRRQALRKASSTGR